ncbi:MAG: hypothetical protein K0R44_1297 [Thermomicrobiales bacterium]|jgi:hypothetical protein|nr:hypothetical protein [Thermomicrobiales bacterium]
MYLARFSYSIKPVDRERALGSWGRRWRPPADRGWKRGCSSR